LGPDSLIIQEPSVAQPAHVQNEIAEESIATSLVSEPSLPEKVDFVPPQEQLEEEDSGEEPTVESGAVKFDAVSESVAEHSTTNDSTEAVVVTTTDTEDSEMEKNPGPGVSGTPDAAYQILYLFQKDGRLIDLLMEDISELDDKTLGGAIRPIHEGCRQLLLDRLVIEPVMIGEEGEEVTMPDVDPDAIKLSGNVPQNGPYTGVLVHRGWRLKECHLPQLVNGWRGNVIAPAEVEIS